MTDVELQSFLTRQDTIYAAMQEVTRKFEEFLSRQIEVNDNLLQMVTQMKTFLERSSQGGETQVES